MFIDITLHGVNINSLFVKKLNDVLHHISKHRKALRMYTWASYSFHGFESASLGVLQLKALHAGITKTRIHMIIFLFRTTVYLSYVTNWTLKEQWRQRIHGFHLFRKFAMVITIL